jgi:hypothetical protein
MSHKRRFHELPWVWVWPSYAASSRRCTRGKQAVGELHAVFELQSRLGHLSRLVGLAAFACHLVPVRRIIFMQLMSCSHVRRRSRGAAELIAQSRRHHPRTLTASRRSLTQDSRLGSTQSQCVCSRLVAWRGRFIHCTFIKPSLVFDWMSEASAVPRLICFVLIRTSP